MNRPLLDRSTYDHPEHFDDEIRAYRTSARYIPTPLESLLFEMSAHRCTICLAPWVEIHHIDELAEGGQTTYENLIVLCPNCHTRVHIEGVPSKAELKHYKLKQEIAYQLPILSRLSNSEREFISYIQTLSFEDQMLFSLRKFKEVNAVDQDEAVQILKMEIGFLYLEESGIVQVERGFIFTKSDGKHVSVNLHVRLTGKGLKWLRYLASAGHILTLKLHEAV